MPALRAADKAAETEALQRAAGRAEHLRRDLNVCNERIDELREQHDNLMPTVNLCNQKVAEIEAALEPAKESQSRVTEQLRLCDSRADIQRTELERIQSALDEAVAEITLIESEQRERRPTSKGADPTTNGRTTVAADELVQACRKFQQFTPQDIAAVLKMAPKSASARLAELVTQGIVIDTGTKFAGKKIFQFSGAEEEQKEHQAESMVIVRDYVVTTHKQFSPADVEATTEVGGDELVAALQELLRKGVIEYAGFDDLELYVYKAPTDAGDAAVRDAALRKQRAATETVAVTRSTPVEGTGKKWNIPNADVRALVQAVERLGGNVKPAPNGHYEVTHPNNRGKRILIAGTPRGTRSVRNDTARIRRELALPELSV